MRSSGDLADVHVKGLKIPGDPGVARQRPHVRYDQRIEPLIRGHAVGDVEARRVCRPGCYHDNPRIEFAPKTGGNENQPEKLACAGHQANGTGGSEACVRAHREGDDHFELDCAVRGRDDLAGIDVERDGAVESGFVVIGHVCVCAEGACLLYEGRARMDENGEKGGKAAKAAL